LERELTLLFHFLGFGLLMTGVVAGFILDRQYRKAPDFAAKATILKSAKPIGIISPFASLIMLVSGIGNMHFLGLGLMDTGWLAWKIMFYAIAVVSGILFGITARKRGALVAQMAAGTSPADAAVKLKGYDGQISLFYLVLPLLLLIILCLSIYGRVGGQ
jgi:protein-S-isoprenylcysteine O-methyltransferase Ste14